MKAVWRLSKLGCDLPRVWHGLAWFASLGAGLSAFMLIAAQLHFEYRLAEGVISTAAFLLYPEQQDAWLYLLGMIVIPLVAFASYSVWSSVSRVLQISCSTDGRHTYFVFLWFIWWVPPLTFLFEGSVRPDIFPEVAAIFFVSSAFLLGHFFLKARASTRSLPAPPPLTLQGAVIILGGILGISFLTSPLLPSPLVPPFWITLASALGLWAVWMIASSVLARHLNLRAQSLAERLAIALLPLAVLPLQQLFWTQVIRDGNVVSETASWTPVWILIGGAIVATGALIIWQLRSAGDTVANSVRPTFDGWFFKFIVPLALYALAFDPNIHGPLDLFHEAESLVPAQTIMAGGVPYKDVVFAHGLLMDPGVALVAFRLFGTTMAGLRILLHILTPLSLVASYYVALLTVGRMGAAFYALLAWVGFLPVFYDWRMVPAMATIAALLLYVRQERRIWIFIAGLLAFLAWITSSDVGLVVLVASIIFLVARTIAEWRRSGAALLLNFVVPQVACYSLLLAYFASVNGLEAFLTWQWEILRVYRDINGMPFPILPGGFIGTRDSFLAPTASVIGTIVLMYALIRRRWKAAHWVVLVLLIGNVTLFNRGLVGGYVGNSILNSSSHFAPLLLAALFALVRDTVDNQSLLNYGTAAVLGVVLLVPTAGASVPAGTLLAAAEMLPYRNRITIPSTWVRSSVERVGPLYIPAEQESFVAETVDFLKGAESFWNFADHDGFFFLSGHPTPIRFSKTHHIVTDDNEREVVAALARVTPQFVLYRSSTAWDKIGGVDRSIRDPIVAEYLLRNYHPVKQIQGMTILEKGAPPSFPTGSRFRVDFGFVPLVQGQELPGILEEGDRVVKGWSFSSGEELNGWLGEHDLLVPQPTAAGLFLRTAGNDPILQNLGADVNPRDASELDLDMTIRACGNEESLPGAAMRLTALPRKSMTMQFFWRAGEDSFTDEQSVLFTGLCDGQEHLYALRLGALPSWMWSAPVTGVRLDPGDTPDVELVIRSIGFAKAQ